MLFWEVDVRFSQNDCFCLKNAISWIVPRVVSYRKRNIFKWKLYKFSNITKENIFYDGKNFEKLSKVCVKYLNEHMLHVNQDRLGVILVSPFIKKLNLSLLVYLCANIEIYSATLFISWLFLKYLVYNKQKVSKVLLKRIELRNTYLSFRTKKTKLLFLRLRNHCSCLIRKRKKRFYGIWI